MMLMIIVDIAKGRRLFTGAISEGLIYLKLLRESAVTYRS